jgi:hypothetical protein
MTPGNRFVMPLISRTGEASTAGDSREVSAGRVT